MDEVAVVGAGELGSAVAEAVARRDLVRAVRLVDDRRDEAAGKALDIAHAAAISRFSTRVTGAADLVQAGSADLVVVADRAGSTEWQGDAGIALLQRILDTGRARTVVCAGAAQRELVERGVRELGIPRTRLIGSAPEALAAAVRALAALYADRSPSDVCLTVLGVPPAHVVVPWEEATVGGLAATRVLDLAARRAISARIEALWPPGPFALAAAAAEVVAALAGRSRHIAACFVAPDQPGRFRTRTAAFPVRLGGEGLIDVEVPPLSVRERVALDTAIGISAAEPSADPRTAR